MSAETATAKTEGQTLLEAMHAPADALRDDLMSGITNGIVNHPRSLQQRIGPSELGTPCEHCLAAKLAGWTEQRDAAWLPTVGTAVHAWLADEFMGTPRWLTETKVEVGDLNGVPITGSADLFDLASGTVIDWKIVGVGTLRTVRASGPSDQYRAQAHLYGRGFARAGHRVERVAIAYLFRNAFPTAQMHLWTEDYDESVAVAVLDRATTMLRRLDAMYAVGADVDAYVSSLPRADGCYSCPRYPDALPEMLEARR